jgi:deferrochelatase/peroxidase EfeB
MSGKCPFGFLSRRSFMKSAGSGVGLLAAASTGLGAITSKLAEAASDPASDLVKNPPHPHPRQKSSISFWDTHQAGIATPQQAHTYFASFDLVAKKREDVVQLLKDWTAASALLTQGKMVEIPKRKTTQPLPHEASYKPSGNPSGSPSENHSDETPGEGAYGGQSTADSGDAQSLPPSRLTLTFGFGAGLFVTPAGVDRYGLAKHRPEALVDLPKFHGDELIEAKTGGDLSVQACSDDPQVAFHAIRQLVRLASGIAQVRWTQAGFVSGAEGPETPRNLMGFKDGTQQPQPSEHAQFVWVGKNGPAWMRNGSYLVARRIRIALEHWDDTEVDFQEQVIGRKKDTGAPLGQKHEREVLDLHAVDKEGNFVIAENSHVRLATAATNDGAQILRRGYSYNDGVNFTAERWPPWRQGMEYDAGLFFVGYQADPRTGFIKIFQSMAKLDALNQFVTHVGSGLFACPPGASKGQYIGQKLFESV